LLRGERGVFLGLRNRRGEEEKGKRCFLASRNRSPRILAEIKSPAKRNERGIYFGGERGGRKRCWCGTQGRMGLRFFRCQQREGWGKEKGFCRSPKKEESSV